MRDVMSVTTSQTGAAAGATQDHARSCARHQLQPERQLVSYHQFECLDVRETSKVKLIVTSTNN